MIERKIYDVMMKAIKQGTVPFGLKLVRHRSGLMSASVRNRPKCCGATNRRFVPEEEDIPGRSEHLN
jgi:hypothetical protein